MPMNNKYGSIIETFISVPIINDTLATYATPPANLQLVQADFTAQTMFASGGASAAGPRIKFAINDRPRILGYGLFCNIADGLVPIDSLDDFEHGPGFGITLSQFDGAGVNQGLIGTQSYRTIILNTMIDIDFAFDVSGVDNTLDSLRIEAYMPLLSMEFATISVNPDYGPLRLQFWPKLIIEHTFPVIVA